MQGEQAGLEAYVAYSAEALRLTIEPEWKAPIIANLETIFKIAALVDGFELPDDAEPAPVFEA
jgi:Protein of unknown function (DUF4089)